MTARKRDWREHDAAVHFRDPRLIRLNGTNRAGRRPHTLTEPTLRLAANDNVPADDDRSTAEPSVPARAAGK